MSKHHLFLLLLSALLIISCEKDCPEEVTTPPANVNLTNGLLAYYPFTGNTNDASGKNNNGTLVGSSLTYDENGKANSALNCAGNNQKMVVPNNGSIVFDTALTISFNAMPRTATNPAYISMVENTTGKGPSFLIGTAFPGSTNFIYSITNNDVACTSVQTGSQVSNLNSGTTLLPEAWYNVICTFRAGVMKLYINGNLIGTQNSANTTMHTCPNAQLIVGGWWNGDPGASFNGKLDEVRLYNRVINSDEIKELSKSFQ